MPKCFCPACQETFTCPSAFEMHRTGSCGDPIYEESCTGKSRRVIGQTPSTRRCLSEREMLARGMARNDKGWWLLRQAGVHWTEAELSSPTPG